MSNVRFAAVLMTTTLSFGCSGSSQTPPATPAEPSSSVEAPSQPAPSLPGEPLFVHESLVDCEGSAPMKCMQVRKSDSEEWVWFYDRIEGFEHEPGYRYELRVEVRDVANPPMDASSKRYRLLEVVSKEKAGD